MAGMLVSQHNVFFMNELMTAIRQAIREGTLDEEEDKWLAPGLRSRDFRGAAEAAPEEGGGEIATPERGGGEVLKGICCS